jgi:hypothetical protein
LHSLVLAACANPLPGPLDNRFSQLYQQLRPDSLPGLPCLERSTSPTIEISYHIHKAGERDPSNHRGASSVAETYCRVQIVARGIPSGCSISPEGQGINDQLIETKGPDPLLSLRGTIISIIQSWLQSVRRRKRCCKSAKVLIQQAIRDISGSLAAATWLTIGFLPSLGDGSSSMSVNNCTGLQILAT